MEGELGDILLSLDCLLRLGAVTNVPLVLGEGVVLAPKPYLGPRHRVRFGKQRRPSEEHQAEDRVNGSQDLLGLELAGRGAIDEARRDEVDVAEDESDEEHGDVPRFKAILPEREE